MICPFCKKKVTLFHCTFISGAKITCCHLCAVKLGLKIGAEVKDERQQMEEKHQD